MEQHLEAFERALLRRNFRPNSIDCYLRVARRFLADTDVPREEISRQHVVAHLDEMSARGFAAQTRNQALAALRVFFREVAGDPKSTFGLRRALVPPYVPVVLSGTEVQVVSGLRRSKRSGSPLATMASRMRWS